MNNHKIWSAILLIIIIGVVWYVSTGGKNKTAPAFVTAKRGTVRQVVSVTGNVKALTDVDLAFERSGKVAGINVSVGDKVYTGEILLSLSNDDLTAALDQAKANLKKAQAGLGDNADQAALNFTQAKSSLTDAIKDSYTKADDVVRNKIYSLFIDPVRYRAKLAFSTDSFLKDDIETGKDTVSDNLTSWYQSLAKISSTSDLESYYNTAKTNLNQIKSLLDECATAVNGLSPEADYTTQVEIDTWKLNISTARTNINTAIGALTSAFDQYKTAGLSVSVSQNGVLAEQATIDQATAGVASAEAELDKSVIKSPIDGVVTNIVPKLGEIVPMSQSVISVISYGDYEVEVFVPEADIAKVKIGDLASTTLDAYGSAVNFETAVIKIDPAATVIDGVPTYKVTLKFARQDDRVKAGMTANLDILTAVKSDVVVIPGRLVLTRDDGSRYVKVLDAKNQSQERIVTVGLRGVNGNIEIISGLNAGDKVVTSQ